MKEEKLYNVLEGFDFKLLDNSEFQEDSVREEIIIPIIKGLGYSANKPNQIIRSRKLLHPFVSIGSIKKDIYIIPDYLFEVDGNAAWILDAKAPKEEIIKSKNVEQAYSYAIHSEVRVNFFALCNGKEFVLFNIEKIDPILHFPIQALPVYWETLKKYVSPEKVFTENHFKLAKDFGLHLKRLGYDGFESLIIPDVPVTQIAQLNPKMFTLSGGIKTEEDRYVVTFDFGQEVFEQLHGKIPDKAFELLSKQDSNKRQVVNFADTVYKITIDCRIGKELQENEVEIFLPFIINRIIR